MRQAKPAGNRPTHTQLTVQRNAHIQGIVLLILGRVYAAMNLTRSPIKSTSGQECRSTPDLSAVGREAMESQITFRKRKQPDDHGCSCNSSDIQELRIEMARISKLVESFVNVNQKTLDNVSEMKNHLTDLKSSNEHNFSVLTNNVSDVKNQIDEIQQSMSSLTLEQNRMKSQISLLEHKITKGEEKMRDIESDLSNFKNTDAKPTGSSESSQIFYNEQIINEVQERNIRQKNIILAGIEEQTSSNAQERLSLDMTRVMNILTSLEKNTPPPTKVFRIGKYDSNKSRRIKVCFDSQKVATLLLRSKSKLPTGIKMYSDQTPSQQKLMLSLQKELARRSQSGETDLIIKYVKGTPRIIKMDSKNGKPTTHLPKNCLTK